MSPVYTFNATEYLELEAQRLGGTPLGFELSDGSTVRLVCRPIADSGLWDGVSVYGYPDFDAGTPHRSQVDARKLMPDLVATLQKRGIVAAFFRLGLYQDVGVPWRDRQSDGSVMGAAVVVDLERDWSDVFMSFRPRLRNQLRGGKSLVIGPSDDVGSFHRMYTENMRRVGAANTYFFSRAYLQRLCSLEGVSLIIASDEEGPVSGAITMAHGPAIYYHLGATGDRGFQVSPLRQVLAWIAEQNAGGPFAKLVLGGGLGGGSDELMRFKLGFSKQTVPVCGLKVVGKPDVYKNLAGVEPDDTFDEAFFPSYRKVMG